MFVAQTRDYIYVEPQVSPVFTLRTYTTTKRHEILYAFFVPRENYP